MNFLRLSFWASGFLALASLASADSQLVTNLKAGKKQTVVCYGTSLTARGAWVGQMTAELEKQYPGLTTVINSGGSGQWSKWGMENVEKQVVAKNPDTVFIEFAINDSVARFEGSVAIAKANLEGMIARILKGNPDCEIILMTMTPGNKHPEGHMSYRLNIEDYYAMYRAVAKEKGLMLIDHDPNWKKLQQEDEAQFLKYVPDTIHPNAEGCNQVVTPVILKALGLGNRK